MPWENVAAFQTSETYRSASEFHSWPMERLSKFVSAFREVFDRAKRNGASDSKAEALAFPIAFHIGRRAASAETLSKVEAEVHYIAAMAPNMAHRTDSTDSAGSEAKFTLVEKALPFLKSLVAGVAAIWDHTDDQVGVIRDIIRRRDAPAEVQAKTDPSIPFYFVASFRTDIPPESRNEKMVSAEWFPAGNGEVLPVTFAKTHAPHNGPALGILQIASEFLMEKEAAVVVEVAALPVQDPPIPPVAPIENQAAAATTKTLEQEQGFANPRENSYMPDENPPTVPEFEAKFASLTKELDAEKKARKGAELMAASMKAEFETAKRVVDELKSAALEQQAEMAAVALITEGKATADQAPYFASLYVKLGREQFEEIAGKLQTTNLGAYGVKAAAQVPISPEAVKAHKERMARLLKETA